MNRPLSPARANYERKMAAARAADAPSATRADATQYELMLVKLAEDRRRLHDLQSIERRAEVKRELLPDYVPWVEGALAGGQGVQDDVLMTVMVWRIDAGDLGGALEIAEHALRHKLSMPDQYRRTTACLIAEEFADAALRKADGITLDMTGQLLQATDLVEREDMPDQVRAKLLKAAGYGVWQNSTTPADKLLAVEMLKKALQLHNKVGVKKDIEIFERDIKNSAPAPASAEGGG